VAIVICGLRQQRGEKKQLSSVKLNYAEQAFTRKIDDITSRNAAADALTSTLAESPSQSEIGEKGRGKEGRERGGGGEETTHNWSLRQTSRMKEQ